MYIIFYNNANNQLIFTRYCTTFRKYSKGLQSLSYNLIVQHCVFSKSTYTHKKEKKIDELTAEYEKAKEEVLAAINELSNPDYQNILIMRYLNDYSWQTICTKMYVSLTTAKRWHWDALNSIKINVGP